MYLIDNLLVIPYIIVINWVFPLTRDPFIGLYRYILFKNVIPKYKNKLWKSDRRTKAAFRAC